MKLCLWLSLIVGLLAGLPTSVAAQTEPLYAGTSYPGLVHQYQGGITWNAISPSLGDAVLCLAEYEGSLYAGTVSWGFTEGIDYYGGRVYRHDGDGEWTVVGSGMNYEVSALAVYHGKLYAGTSWAGGHLLRYDGGTTWTLVADAEGWSGVRSLWVHTDGYLYLGDCLWDLIGRYDESGFGQAADLDGSCIWDFSDYGGALYAAAYLGRVHRSTDGLAWYTLFDYDEWNLWDLWELEQFDGFLYLADDGGLLRRMGGALYRQNVWTAPTSIISMLAHGRDGLYIGTGMEATGGFGEPVGVVYRYDGAGDPELISGMLGQGVQCLYQPHTFPDIRGEHWAHEEIEGCREANILGGYPDGHFHPIWAVSRAQMAVFISRAVMGGDDNVPDGPASPSYPDVDSDYWAYKYIECTTDNSICQGFNDGSFHPEYRLTRDQMAVFVARATVAPTTSVLADYVPAEPRNFPDVTNDHWAYTYVEYCVEHGIVGGYPDGYFHPKTVCTRDQITVFLARAFDLDH
jgi:hypothetical protein